MSEVFVSICIPTYNGEKYLRQCLDSCLDQEYKDYEIVICDDGSTDGTIAVLESYAKMHAKIRLFKNERNLGLVENWNKCMTEAKGQWIKFVFQDDFIRKNCLSKFTDAIEGDSSFIVCKRNFLLPQDTDAEMQKYYSHTVRTLENTSDHKEKYFNPKQLTDIAMQNMCMNFIAEPSLIFFKKSLFSQYGKFNPFLKQICDFEFALRMSTQKGLIYIPEQLCAFRIHKDSTTNSNLNKKYFVLRYIEPLLYAYFLLFDSHFENFRKNLSISQRFKLNIYFKVKAFHAAKVNAREGHDHFIFSKENELFKEIKDLKNGDLITRLVALIKK